MPEILIKYGARHQMAQQNQTASLFDFEEEEMAKEARPRIRSAMEWAPIVRLDKERELVGMYLSAHPLDPYYLELTYGTTTTLGGREDIIPADGLEITFGGIVTDFTERLTRNGRKMYIVKLEDFTSSSDFVLFEDQKNLYGHLCQPGTAIMVRGRYQANRSGEIRFAIGSINLLEQFRGKLIKGITFNLVINECIAFSDRIRAQEKQQEGQRVELRFLVYSPELDRNILLSSGKYIYINKQFLSQLNEDGVPFTIDKFN